MKKSPLIAAVLFVAATAQTHAAPVTTVTPYLSAADIPSGFYLGGGPTFLEDFEDGTLDGGITASVGSVIGPGGLTDSVDADDGTIDGSGSAGRSFFSGGGATGITFRFSSLVTAAGLVWTDGTGSTTFRAFDDADDLIGELTVSVATGGITGQTDEDTFFGIKSAGGIRSIFVSNSGGGIEVDHVQYGDMATSTTSPIPLPASGVLLLAGLAGLTRLRRRARA